MNLVGDLARRLLVVAVGWAATLSVAESAAAQELPRVSVTRPLRVAGLSMDPRAEDLLGLSRIKFQGLIASELAAVGYVLADAGGAPKKASSASPPLTLVGYIREEICDDEARAQCRVAIQWELQDERGVAVYRTTTRAVDQAVTLEKLRRQLVEGALRSLLQRRRFALQLTDVDAAPRSPVVGRLGFKQCRRAALPLPQAARAAAASLVFVEAGSSLTSGAIISGDGLILTNASTLDEQAPLRVRFSGEQALAAKIVALDRAADVALLRVAAHTDATCVPVREAPLSAGMAAFGISSELSEGHAWSLAGGVVQRSEQIGAQQVLHVDPLIARAEGGPLLDEQGQLVAVVSHRSTPAAHGTAPAVAGISALEALNLKAAAITDPRLLEQEGEAAPAVGYVRDHDDPPFPLTKRYTYGTSTTAHRVRTVALVTGGLGAAVVAGSWLNVRATRNMTQSQHDRAVIYNDIGWALLGLGALGVGASFAWPEGHDVVAVHSASRRHLFVGVGGAGVQVGGQL